MSASPFPCPPPSPHPAPLPFPSTSFGCPELDLSITLSSTPKTSYSQLKPCPRGHSRLKRDTQVCFEDPVVIKVIPEPQITISSNAPPQKQPIRGQRTSRGSHHAPRQSVVPAAAAINPDLGCLERAELNTTLTLKADLESLQGNEFNAQRAIQETLRRSERTKNVINSRATEVVNISRSQFLFNSLVSIEVQKDELISLVQQNRRLMVTRTHSHDNKAVDGPTLNLFMPSDLLRQKPLPPDEVLVNQKPHPSPRPTLPTFDLYRRQIRWGATP